MKARSSSRTSDHLLRVQAPAVEQAAVVRPELTRAAVVLAMTSEIASVRNVPAANVELVRPVLVQAAVAMLKLVPAVVLLCNVLPRHDLVSLKQRKLDLASMATMMTKTMTQVSSVAAMMTRTLTQVPRLDRWHGDAEHLMMQKVMRASSGAGLPCVV